MNDTDAVRAAATASPILVDEAVAAAVNMPHLVQQLVTVDPKLAESLTAKPLLKSRTIYVQAATLLLAWACARYGLDLDANAQAALIAAAVMASTAVMRAVSRAPIGGIVSVAPATG